MVNHTINATPPERLQQYLQTTISAQRPNHLKILSAHRNYTESLNVQKIASEFVSRNQKRQIAFGKVWCVSDCFVVYRLHDSASLWQCSVKNYGWILMFCQTQIIRFFLVILDCWPHQSFLPSAAVGYIHSPTSSVFFIIKEMIRLFSTFSNNIL